MVISDLPLKCRLLEAGYLPIATTVCALMVPSAILVTASESATVKYWANFTSPVVLSAWFKDSWAIIANAKGPL